MSCAIHAYRLILKARNDLESRCLALTKLQQLATICPRCFGPGEPSKIPGEPDYIVCLDGNFQHKRHAAASREIEEIGIDYPPLFLTPEEVNKWAPGPGRTYIEIPLVGDRHSRRKQSMYKLNSSTISKSSGSLHGPAYSCCRSSECNNLQRV